MFFTPRHSLIWGTKAILTRFDSKGWRYRFSLNETRRLVLRSQGTSLSARMLIDHDLKIPGKYFSIARCYRVDVVDSTHLTEFNQVEGIVLGEDLTFRDLLGILKMFAVEIAGQLIDPTGAMTLGMPRMSERPDWTPLKVFTDERSFTVLESLHTAQR